MAWALVFESFAAALAAAVFIAIIRMSFAAWTRRASLAGAEAAFTGPAPDDDELRGGLIFGAFAFCLVLLIGALGFVLGNMAIRSTAIVMGFSRQVSAAALPNGAVLLWMFLILVLWIELGHFARLKSIWSRARFACLLFALPLALQILAWFSLGSLITLQLADARELGLAENVATLIAAGVLPFFVPSIQGRIVAPAILWIGKRIPQRWRPAAAYSGNAVLSAIAAGLAVLWIVLVSPRSHLSSGPVSTGSPHICSNQYPAQAVRLGEQGVTTLAFVITPDGGVDNLTVVGSSGYEDLDVAAALCASRWTYRPAVANGRPVAVPWKVRVVWRLR